MKVEKCPLCNGSGKKTGNGTQSYASASTSLDLLLPKCNGCNGKGWVEVKEYEYNLSNKTK